MSKTFVVISIGVIGILTITPVCLYIYYFGSNQISQDPTSWGALGDYFGGVLNPIISVASLAVLAYLTYVVAEQSSKSTANLFALERRMQAYDEIAKFLHPINSIKSRMDSAMLILNGLDNLPPSLHIERLFKVVDELRGLNTIYADFYLTLFSFKVRYGHLFRYDFDADEFQYLVSESKRVSEMMPSLVGNISNLSDADRKDFTLEKLRTLFVPVINNLRNELFLTPGHR